MEEGDRRPRREVEVEESVAVGESPGEAEKDGDR
jgi:hypothetical protein